MQLDAGKLRCHHSMCSLFAHLPAEAAKRWHSCWTGATVCTKRLTKAQTLTGRSCLLPSQLLARQPQQWLQHGQLQPSQQQQAQSLVALQQAGEQKQQHFRVCFQLLLLFYVATRMYWPTIINGIWLLLAGDLRVLVVSLLAVPPDDHHSLFCLLICSAPSSSSAAAAATAVAAAAAARASPCKDSKLLVRAAQRLLRNAQAEAEQVDRALTVAAAAAPERQPPAAAAGKKQTAAVSADRGSPLATVLAQYKEAQAAWAQEKVQAMCRMNISSSMPQATASCSCL
jgi:pyruvate/2-oxoglutarate dehydrogenase complex dihydrolipoamide acyltransferase (E2) component